MTWVELKIDVLKFFCLESDRNEKIELSTVLFDEKLFENQIYFKYVVIISSSNVNTRTLKTHFKKSRQDGFFEASFKNSSIVSKAGVLACRFDTP